MNLKNLNNEGFMLAEVLMAMAIVALVMTPIYITQGNSVRSVGNWSHRLQIIFSIKNFLQELHFKAVHLTTIKTSEKKTVPDLDGAMTYELKPLKDPVYKKFKDMSLEIVTFRPNSKSGRPESMMRLLYKPKPDEKAQG